jgi:hypothetical protein
MSEELHIPEFPLVLEEELSPSSTFMMSGEAIL